MAIDVGCVELSVMTACTIYTLTILSLGQKVVKLLLKICKYYAMIAI